MRTHQLITSCIYSTYNRTLLFPDHYRIAIWKSNNWFKLSGGVDNTVRAIAIKGTDVYVGGDFTTANYNGGPNVGANYIAKFDGTNWTALGTGMNGAVYSLVMSGSDLYAGGNFTTAGGTTVSYAAKYSGSTWSSLGGTVYGTVTTMGFMGGSMYAAASYASAYQNIAKFTDGANPLPVELSSFSASSARGAVTLNWFTATEVNNAGFEVERKSETWQKIGFIEGHGSTNAPQSYTFTDKQVSGKVLYRLKQIDRDGKFEYSKEVEATASAPTVFGLSQNFPNPFNPTTNISFTVPSTGRATLKIFNTLGQEVATLFNGEAQAGIFNQVQFNASGFASGMYFSRLEYNGKVQMTKMTLIK